MTITVQNYAYWLNKTLGPTRVIAPSVPFYCDTDPFPVHRFLSIPTFIHPPYRIGLPGLDPGLRARLRDTDFSLLHAHSPFGAGHAALRLARRRGIPIVATFHSKFRDNLELAVPSRRLVDRQIGRIVKFFESVDQVWIPQKSVAETLREYGYSGPCEVVENGIDFVLPEDIGIPRARGGTYLGLPDHALVGLYVGQLIVEKNLEFLLRSLPPVAAAVPDFRMVMVGGGGAARQLKNLAWKLGLGERVVFCGPVPDRGLLQDLYARGDLFLFPSRFDNAPLVVREAAAFRTPAVLLAGTTAAEVIRDGGNGFLAGGGTEAFARRVIEALERHAVREQVGINAQASLCRSWEDVVGEVRDRYLNLLKR